MESQREAVAQALAHMRREQFLGHDDRQTPLIGVWDRLPESSRDAYRAQADAALAALGLDDLDAAVVRATDAVHARVVGQHLPRPPSLADIAQAAVIAALTATTLSTGDTDV